VARNNQPQNPWPLRSPGWPASLRWWGEPQSTVVQASRGRGAGLQGRTERCGARASETAKAGSDLCPCAVRSPLWRADGFVPPPRHVACPCCHVSRRLSPAPFLVGMPRQTGCCSPTGCYDGTSLAFDHPTRRRKKATDPPFNASPGVTTGWVHGRTGVRHWSVPAVHARTFHTHHLHLMCAVRFGATWPVQDGAYCGKKRRAGYTAYCCYFTWSVSVAPARSADQIMRLPTQTPDVTPVRYWTDTLITPRDHGVWSFHSCQDMATPLLARTLEHLQIDNAVLGANKK
jgi:hypothetical protein